MNYCLSPKLPSVLPRVAPRDEVPGSAFAAPDHGSFRDSSAASVGFKQLSLLCTASLRVASSCRRAVPRFRRTVRGFRGGPSTYVVGGTSNQAASVGDSLAFVSTFLVLGAPSPSRSLKQGVPSPCGIQSLALMLLRVRSCFQRSPRYGLGSGRVARADVAAFTSETGHQPASLPPSSFSTILAVYSSSTLPGYCTGLPVLGFVMFCRHKDDAPSRVSALQSFAP